MKNLKNILSPKTIIIILSLIVWEYNIVFLSVYTRQKYNDKTLYLEPGLQFEPLASHLKDVDKIGYISDKNLDREKNDGTYLQAQYFLAPTIIKFKETDHPYFILDSDNRGYIIQTLLETKGKRVANNDYGQALIKRQK